MINITLQYESLRTKFDELKAAKKNLAAASESTTDEGLSSNISLFYHGNRYFLTCNTELRELVSRMREDMKELSHDQTVVRKKLKEQRRENENIKRDLEEEVVCLLPCFLPLRPSLLSLSCLPSFCFSRLQGKVLVCLFCCY